MSHRTKTKRKEAQTIDQVLQQLDEIVDTSIAQKTICFCLPMFTEKLQQKSKTPFKAKDLKIR
jgi:hypothetical protein